MIQIPSLCFAPQVIIIDDPPGGGGPPPLTAPTLSVSFTTTAATLTWSGASMPNGIAGYEVKWGTTPGNYTQTRDVGLTTTSSIYPLAAATTYYFMARAYDPAHSFTPNSNEVSGQLVAGGAGTNKSGRISSSTTWDLAGSPYTVTSTVSVYADSGLPAAVLTIQPGVVVKFNSGASLNIGLGSSQQGSLIAQGTSASPIIFTSSSATPVAGSWGRIDFDDGTVDATAILENAGVQYGGGASTTAEVYASFSSPTIRSSIILDSAGRGVQLYNSSATVSSCTIQSPAGYGLYVSGTSNALISNNTIANSIFADTSAGNPTFTGNTLSNYDAWPAQVGADDVGELLASGAITGATSAGRLDVLGETLTVNATWPKKAFPIVMKSAVTIGNSPTVPVTLTIGAGAVLKFDSGARLYVGGSSNQGSLIAVGTTSDPILFTTSNAAPAAGQWQGISFENGTVDATSVLDRVTVEYAGQIFSAGVQTSQSAPAIRNTTVRNVTGYGFYLYLSSASVLNACTVSSTTSYGIYIYSSSAAGVTNSTISGTGSYSIFVSSTSNGTFQSNVLEKGLKFDSASGNPVLLTNALQNYDAWPAQVGADDVGELMTSNSFIGATAAGRLDVLGETLTSNATWPNRQFPIILHSSVTIGSSPTVLVELSIAAGLVLKFDSGSRLYVGGSSNQGALRAAGTSAAPILFTTSNAVPAAGQWQGIQFDNGTVEANSVLDWVIVDYAGQTYAMGVETYQSSPPIRNTTVRNIAGTGIHLYLNSGTVLDACTITSTTGYGVLVESSSAAGVRNSTITGTGNYGIYVSSTSDGTFQSNVLEKGLKFASASGNPVITGNTLNNYDAWPAQVGADDVGELLGSNTLNGATSAGRLDVLGETLTVNATWPKKAFPIVMKGTVTIGNSPTVPVTLTIGAGAVLKFDSGTRLYVGGSSNQGSLIAVGTTSEPILFTTSNAAPAAGQWQGIYFDNGTVDATSVLDRATVEYAGQTYAAGVETYQSSPPIRNTTVRNIAGAGIHLYLNSGTVLDACTITSTTGYGVFVESSSAAGVRNSTITGTGNYGIYVSSTSDGTFQSNVLEKGLKFTSASGNPVILTNALQNYDAWPAQVGADDVGELMTSNSFIGATAAGRLDVLGETLTSNATWPNRQFPIILHSFVTIGNSPTVLVELSIAAGLVLKFDSGSRLYVGGSSSQGALRAAGTSAAPILFTTSNAVPAAGQWQGISFENGTVEANSVLDWVIVDYAGQTYAAGVETYQSSPPIRNTTVRNIAGAGIHLYLNSGTVLDACTITSTTGYGVFVESSSAAGVRNSTITGTGNYGIYVSSTSDGTFQSNVLEKGLKFTSASGNPVITGNTLNNYDAWPAQVGADDVGELLNSNTINGATAAGRLDVLGETMTVNATWPKKAFPIVMKGTVTIGNSPTVPVTLTVGAGALLKFDSSTRLYVGGSSNLGSLIAVGTGVDPVLFTTSNPTPAAGQWQGLSFENGTVDATSLLDMVVVQYAGQSYGSGVEVSSSSPTIRGSTISSNTGHGLLLQSSSANIQFNNVTSNTQYGIQVSSSPNSVIQHNTFAANTLGAISNTTTQTMDARFNWYGSATGPGGSGPGTGQSVTANVGFDPWQASAAEPSYYFQEAYLSTPTFRPGSFARFFVQVPRRSTWTLKILDSGGSVVRTYTGPNDSYFQVDWDGRNGAGVAQPDGTYRYQIEAVDNHESLVAAPVIGRVALDATYAVGEVISPTHLLTFGIGTPVIVEGTAGGSGFTNYVVQAAPGVFPSSSSFVNVSPTVTSPVTGGVLGTWNTTGFNNGLYTMRLLVTNTLAEKTAVNLGVLVLSINTLSRDRAAFSPNGDGSRDDVTVSALLSIPSSWTISIYDAVTSNGIRTYTGFGSIVTQTWDGRTGGGLTAPEALYRFELMAASGGTSVQSSTTSTIDLTPPGAAIAAPASGTDVYATVPIDGTANDPTGQLESYTLEYGLGATPTSYLPIGSPVTTPVTGGRLGNWSTNDAEGSIPVANGTAVIRLTSMDWAGNSATAQRPVNLDNLFISSVTIAPRTINTFLGGQSTIAFTLNKPAFVNVSAAPESGGSGIWGVGMPMPAGVSSMSWNGFRIAGPAVPDEAYIFTISADAGSGRLDTFNPIAAGPSPSISGTVDPSYNPYKNDYWSTTVTLNTPSRVTLQMNPAGAPPQFDVFTGRPYQAGTFPILWDGRDPAGALITTASDGYFPQPVGLKTNYVLVTGSTPTIAGMAAAPYKMAMSYDHVASLNFTLDRDATVTLYVLPPNVTNPDDPSAVKVWDSVPAGEGDYEVLFDPINIAVSGQDTMLFSNSGVYTFAVKAMNAQNGATMLLRGVVNIER